MVSFVSHICLWCYYHTHKIQNSIIFSSILSVIAVTTALIIIRDTKGDKVIFQSQQLLTFILLETKEAVVSFICHICCWHCALYSTDIGNELYTQICDVVLIPVLSKSAQIFYVDQLICNIVLRLYSDLQCSIHRSVIAYSPSNSAQVVSVYFISNRVLRYVMQIPAQPRNHTPSLSKL